MILNDDRLRIRSYYLSLLISVILLLIKVWAFKLTSSQAVLSDAIESIVNVVMPVVGLIALSVAHRPADKDHPYGHGKVEYFSSAMEGGLIFAAAIMIFVEAIKSLLFGIKLREIDWALSLVVLTAVVNLVLGMFLLKMSKNLKSIALEANARHVLSDVWTTIGVLVGLTIVKLTDKPWVDPITAILVGLLLAWNGWKLVRTSAAGLLDEEDKGLIIEIAELFNRNRTPGIIHIHHSRVIRSGRYHHIDAHVVVPEYWSVTTAHNETVKFEKAFIQDYSVDGEIHFHIDPCHKAYCEVCEVKECPIRQEKFQQLMPFTVESLTSPEEPEEFINKRK